MQRARRPLRTTQSLLTLPRLYYLLFDLPRLIAATCVHNRRYFFPPNTDCGFVVEDLSRPVCKHAKRGYEIWRSCREKPKQDKVSQVGSCKRQVHPCGFSALQAQHANELWFQLLFDVIISLVFVWPRFSIFYSPFFPSYLRVQTQWRRCAALLSLGNWYVWRGDVCTSLTDRRIELSAATWRTSSLPFTQNGMFGYLLQMLGRHNLQLGFNSALFWVFIEYLFKTLT